VKDVLSIFALIVFLAMLAVAVKTPGTPRVINAASNLFTSSLRTAATAGAKS
jgi:hypothetical protein